ncbi:hypothetical protein CDAR_447681 [Caerostris darwini]|uniref:Uncharacterized protein n=1 Tax=Caerostris darwini TaxID=1538125 RepID=A0AAV4PRJ4_9ARAC|nr:hypothetical protein CDAR_447681 [Caerostris darwini]
MDSACTYRPVSSDRTALRRDIFQNFDGYFLARCRHSYPTDYCSTMEDNSDGLENVASWPDGDGLKILKSRHNEMCEENRSSVGRSRVNGRNSFLRKDKPRLLDAVI